MEFIKTNFNILISIGLFTITTYGYIPYCKMVLDRTYIKTLYELFKPLKVLKSSNRHSGGASTISNGTTAANMEVIFHERKAFFQGQVNEGDTTLLTKTLFVHVVGTKGKGSTCEFLRIGCMNLSSNLHKDTKYDAKSQPRPSRVGVFTSPHMHTARERVKIGSTLISKADVVRFGELAINSFRQEGWVVFFDYLLLIAIKYFQEQNVDICILEAGIGGRYDSTNFIENGTAITKKSTDFIENGTAITKKSTVLHKNRADIEGGENKDLRLWVVIANISLDHQSMLGSTVEEIAWQKVGAIKQGCHVFTCATTQLPSVMRVIRDTCQAQGAVLHEVELLPDCIGDTVRENQQLADAVIGHMCSSGQCAHVTQEGSSVNSINEQQFFWPCRMEKFKVPLARTHGDCSAGPGPPNKTDVLLILDGCHNGYSVGRFMEWIHRTATVLLGTDILSSSNHLTPTSTTPPPNTLTKPVIYTIFGAGMDKKENIIDMLRSVGNYSDKIVLVRSKHFRSMGMFVVIFICIVLSLVVLSVMIVYMICLFIFLY